MKISLCMIVKNEEAVLDRCLSSVKDLADEIVIADTGSTDRTKEIAKKYTDKVVDFTWIDDFSAARNFAFSHATMDYVMWLDADDVLLPEDQAKLRELKQSMDRTVDAVSMNYACDFDDHGNVALMVRRFRIVKRSKNFKWYGMVHEDLAVSGNVMESDIVITHKKIREATDRNLTIYMNQLKRGKVFTLQDIFHFARELHQHRKYEQAIEYYLKFLETDGSTNENKIFVCSRLADCYYQLGQTEKELEFTFKSFSYDIPRSDACCRLGYHFLQKDVMRQAIYWYTQALTAPQPENSWAIVNEASRTWLPHMQLGQCYFRLKDYEQSYEHFKNALTYRPNVSVIDGNINTVIATITVGTNPRGIGVNP